MNEYRWLNELSSIFLKREYLLPNQTVDERVDIICNKAEQILKMDGFAQAFKDNIKKGWYSLSTPIWVNFGTNRGLPISCFGSLIDDTMESILHTHAEVGMMSKYGGGTSAYFGKLRSRGEAITQNGQSSGAVHFMQMFEMGINLISQGSCYREGTEVLTNNGFKDFRDITETDKLAQLDKYNNIDFTLDYELVVNEFDGELKSVNGLKKDDGFALDVTPNHRMVISKLKTKNGQKYWPDYTEIVEAKGLNVHRDNRFHLAGKVKSGNGLSFEDRLLIAYQADGIKDNINRRVRFHFSKPRKIERLKWICDNLNIIYDIYINKDGSTDINLPILSWVKKDDFKDWIKLDNLSFEWCSEFLEELKYWDGCASGSSVNNKSIQYFSSNKDNIDLVQAIASMCNKRTCINTRWSEGNRDFLYNINITNKPYRSGESLCISNTKYKGKVYCAIVPKGRLLIRYNEKVCVCGNTRRGSFAAYLDADHKDILEFLQIRNEGSPIQSLSFGVCVSDQFLKDVINGDKDKRNIWAKIIQSRFNKGYPYILFTGNVNKNKPDVYLDKQMDINSSNLCSEIMLPSTLDESFVCDLSSMNILYYDEWKDTNAVELLTYFLDAVMTEFIEKAKSISFMERTVNFATKHRAIGIGWLGYHSYLQSKMIPFDSMEAKYLNVEVAKTIQVKSYNASKELAVLFGEPEYLKGYGRRNTTLTAIAPTKSSAFIIGQASEGIEPHKANIYIKDLAKGKFTIKNIELEKLLDSKNRNTDDVWDSILAHAGSVQHLTFLNEREKQVFKTFAEISPMEIVIQASQRQKYIDQSQSLNLMIDPLTPVKEVNHLFLEAWKLGVKSFYYQFSVNAAQQLGRSILTCTSCEG